MKTFISLVIIWIVGTWLLSAAAESLTHKRK